MRWSRREGIVLLDGLLFFGGELVFVGHFVTILVLVVQCTAQ
jgi:hypothetical protein